MTTKEKNMNKKTPSMRSSTNGYDLAKTTIICITTLIVAGLAVIAAVSVSLANAPVTFSADGGIDCNAATDGSLNFGGRTVWINDTDERYGGMTHRYAFTQVIASTVNVPDFREFKLNHIDARCQANGAVHGQIPALLVINAIGEMEDS